MQPTEESSDYLDPALPTPERVTDLLERMTLEEKIGQLTGTYVGEMTPELANDVDDVARQIREYYVGSASPFGTGAAYYNSLPDVAEVANELQRVAVEETRLGIPLLLASDAIHGHAYIRGATVFPNNLGAAATWDTDLVERVANATASEFSATGGNHNYSPTCDVARDPRWGRTGETFGESPHLVGEMAAAKVRGYREGDDPVLTTAKHFPAYGGPERGEDAAPVDVSDYRLRSVYLRPFQTVLDAGTDTVMACYNSINGEPVHGSSQFLTELLRDELGFDGVVASDWAGVYQIERYHKTAASLEDAVKQSYDAGLDIASIGGVSHAEHLIDVVRNGDIPESKIDEKVRRVLRAKFDLGLFEEPYTDVDAAMDVVGNPDHQELAVECARSSITLLENRGNVLPLSGDADVLVTGPNADSLINQYGGWSAFEDGDDLTGETIRQAIDARASDATVTYEPGTGINEPVDVDAAVAAAEDADVAVVALGENWYIHEFGPQGQAGIETGEFPARNQLRLPDAQRELVQRIANTGTPTVGVVVAGRPLIIDWMADHLPGLLYAFYPGTGGGRAIAAVLFGDENPGGRLPISIPRSHADIPVHHDYLRHPHPIGDGEHPSSYDPLYPFGYGRSYTDFQYRDLALSEETVGPDDTVEVSVTVANVGERAGDDVVQVFVGDRHSSRVTPKRELRGFERVHLKPGEERVVTVPLSMSDLGVVQPAGTSRTEPGEFDVTVGDLGTELVVETE